MKAINPARRAVKEYLVSLQTWQLKHLATNTGLSTGSNKAETAESIITGLSNLHHGGGKVNYKSVDMGVKNLAFCVVQARHKPTSTYKLLDWQRLNVLTSETTPIESDAGVEATESSTLTTSKNMYSPSNLAPAAARLASRLANEHQPSAILIERQRFRSAGGSAVQEWTLRVNSLEAMLWASLQTMRTRGDDRSATFPNTHEISPARIAAFWNARGRDWSLSSENLDSLLPAETSKTKKKAADADEGAKRGMEKSEKITIVRNWFQNGDVDVEKSIQPLAHAFMQTVRAKKSEGDLVVGKKDDLADCVVQGVTFALWERNRVLLSGHLASLQ